MKTPTRIVAGSGAVAALLAVGCARPGGDLSISAAAEAAPTVQLLTDAADVSDGQPYRFAITAETTGTPGATHEDDVDDDLAIEIDGAFDGERTQTKVDLSRSVPPEELPSGADPDELFVETITDSTTLWARAPAFAVTEEPDPDAPRPVVEIMEALGEGWITVDVESIAGIDPDWAACVLGGQRAAPSAYLELMRSASGLAGLGSDEIDGDAVGGMSGEVTLADLLRMQQPDGMPLPGEAPDALEQTTLPVEAWLDDDGHIRRITTTEDTAETTAAFVEADLLPDDALDRDLAVVTQTVELWDHGDDEIVIEVPDDAVDMTDTYGWFLLASGALPVEDADELERELAELEALHDELDALEDLQAGLPEPPPYPEGYPTEPPPYPEGYPTEPPPYPEGYPTEPPPYPGGYTDSYPTMEQDLAELDRMYEELESMPDLPPIAEVPEYTPPPGY